MIAEAADVAGADVLVVRGALSVEAVVGCVFDEVTGAGDAREADAGSTDFFSGGIVIPADA